MRGAESGDGRAMRPGELFWRSLDELSEEPGFRRWVDQEFPAAAFAGLDSDGRREFLKVMAASLALAGLVSCGRSPNEPLVPYAHAEDRIIPGVPLYFATTLTHQGYGHGVLVKSTMGRPTKVEGNPEHPAVLGASSIFDQAAILSLYDPDRSQTVRNGLNISTWENFRQAIRPRLEAIGKAAGRGLHIVMGTVTSPTLVAQLQELTRRMPEVSLYAHEPVDRGAASQGAALATGRALDAVYRFDRADVVVSLDSNFLYDLPGHVRYTHDFGERRRALVGEGKPPAMSRVYVAEPDPTITGAAADHRLRSRRTEIARLAAALAGKLGVPGAPRVELPEEQTRWVAAAAEDLGSARGRGVLIAGVGQPAEVHALVMAVNSALGNLAGPVGLIEPVGWGGLRPRVKRMADLVQELAAGRVDTLILAGVNPVYDAPADLGFAETMRGAGVRVHWGLYWDETGRASDWHLPASHELESWGDARAFDGTASIIQPLIAPLYQGRSAHELVALLSGSPGTVDFDAVRGAWAKGATGEFEGWWRGALTKGVVEGSAAREVRAEVRGGIADWGPRIGDSGRGQGAVAKVRQEERKHGQGTGRQAKREPADIELAINPDPTVWDGRHANNGWLQELPKPISRLTWDNALHVSPATAAALRLKSEDLVELADGERRVRAAVLISPGHADGAGTLTLGYGRVAAGRAGEGLGFDAYALRRSESPWVIPSVSLRRLGKRYQLATVQGHTRLHGRDLVRSATLAEFVSNPGVTGESEVRTVRLNFYPQMNLEGAQWGMVIDMSACTGCQACVLACVAENNTPVVGKREVAREREMHWLRIDQYYTGPEEDPEMYRQPVLCMHCEKAPCELVCPVGATQHSRDGLNEMVYNRCIGTRYCSNNCPYKVRRFNFFRYATAEAEVEKMRWNPDVSVRARGVMEKCTYCVQRIRAADIESRKSGRPIPRDSVVTACQQACASLAIVFGDINDPGSRVAQLKKQPHNYGMLEELNTQPRTTYLAAIRNPSPALPRREGGA